MGYSIDQVMDDAGAGRFQRRLLGIFGLVWAADAMQVLAVGFTSASIAATFGISLPEALQIGTVFFFGMLIGASLFGRLADRFGRRRILLITVALDAVFGLLSVFAPNLAILFILRFLTGVAVGGTLPVDYAMMAEFLPAKNRGRWLVILEGFWAVGTIVVAVAAWIASINGTPDAWRWIFAVTALPALIGIWLRLWVPESPQFLLRTGQTKDLTGVLNRVLTTNGKPALPANAEIQQPPAQPAAGIFSPSLRRRTISILLVWLLVSISYYGVFTWLPARLASEGIGYVRGYDFLVLVALAQLPGYALAAWGVEALGRKPTLIAFLLLSALGCLLFALAGGDTTMIGGAILLMSFALLGTWGALYAFTPELYPTTSRGTGMGAAGSAARLGGLLAPSIMGLVFVQDFTLAIGLFAGLLVLAAGASVLVDAETRSVALD
jgi:putative MFS transporter